MPRQPSKSPVVFNSGSSCSTTRSSAKALARRSAKHPQFWEAYFCGQKSTRLGPCLGSCSAGQLAEVDFTSLRFERTVCWIYSDLALRRSISFNLGLFRGLGLCP